MKRLIFLLIFLVSLCLLFLCKFTGNIYNPDDPAYIKPYFTIDTSSSTVLDGDTVTSDTLRIVLIGNDIERHHNFFRWSLDSGEWSKWDGDGEPEYEIRLTGLLEGSHSLAIEVCYDPDEEIVDSVITFLRVLKPSVAATVDTDISIFAGAACTLWVKAEGSGGLEYRWYHGSVLLDQVDNDTLFINTVSLADSGVYYCTVVSNWGEARCPDIRLRVVFRILYDGNGNTGGMVPVDTNGYTPGSIVTTLGNTGNLIRRGYTFAGWNTKADGTGNNRDSSDIFKMDTFDLTLYAKWTPNPSFPLSYNANGASSGKVPDTTRLYRAGELIIVAGNSGNLVKASYTFTGWNTKADGSGNGYGENDVLEMGDEAIILYAQWSNNPTFTVTYDKNSAEAGDVPVDARRYEKGDTVTVAGNTGNLSRSGYTFTGWNTQPEGDSGIAYTPGSFFIIGGENVKLYARWTARPVYTLTYVGNGNTGGNAPEAISNEEGATITIAGQGTLIKKGYSFTGWNTAADGSGETYTPNSVYTIGARNDTLYAQWKINLYTVTYDGNGSDGGTVPPPTKHLYNSEATLATETPGRTGYTFYCWNTSPSGDGVDYRPGDKVVISDNDITLYARWTINRYTIFYRGNGNTGGKAPDSVRVAYNDSVEIAGKGSLERTGYTFTGWNTQADGSGTTILPGSKFVMGAEDVILYAKWTKNFTVTFNSQGGSSVPSQLVKQEGGHAVAPTSPTLSSCNFDGWYKEPQCFNRWDFSTDVVVSDTTLYAGYTVTDIDGNVYKTVLIGNQRWMVENLKVRRYRDGASIPEMTDNSAWAALSSPAYCWYENDSATYNSTYGILYNWYAVNTGKLAPEGWHVPTEAEWDTLATYLGGLSVAGGKLKEAGTAHWNSPNPGATNESGFSALPGGYRHYDGTFSGIGTYGAWWSASEYDTKNSWIRYLYYENEQLYKDNYEKIRGFSVRCVRD